VQNGKAPPTLVAGSRRAVFCPAKKAGAPGGARSRVTACAHAETTSQTTYYGGMVVQPTVGGRIWQMKARDYTA